MRPKLIFALGMLVTFLVLAVQGSVPNPFPYSIPGDTSKHTLVSYNRVNATTTAATLTFGGVSKTVLVQNEGSQPARLSVDGSTASTAHGVLIGGGGSYSDPNWCTETLSYIRAGSADVSLTFQVTQ